VVKAGEVALLGDVVGGFPGVGDLLLLEPLAILLQLFPVRRGDELFLVPVQVILLLPFLEEPALVDDVLLAFSLLLLRDERLDVPALSLDALVVRRLQLLLTRVLEAVEVPVVVEDGGVRLERLLVQLGGLYRFNGQIRVRFVLTRVGDRVAASDLASMTRNGGRGFSPSGRSWRPAAAS
jgi:hypothetical protein